MVGAEYNSIVRQDRVKNYLPGLRLSAFVKDGTDILATLEKTYKTISELAPQVPRSHHGESYKFDECAHLVIAIKAAKRKLEDYSRKRAARPAASAILFQLCAQLNAAEVTGNGDDDANEQSDEASEAAANEVGIFEALVDGSEPVPKDGDGTTSDHTDFALRARVVD
eukprot:contig_11548_g2754